MSSPLSSGGALPASEWPLRHPAAAFLGLLLLASVGAAFALRLPPDRFAAPPAPMLVVEAALPGLGPEVVERELGRPLASALGDLPDLHTLESRSRPGRAVLHLHFASALARDAAAVEARERLARAPFLAPAMNGPTVEPVDAGAIPAAVYAVVARARSSELARWTSETLAAPARELAGTSTVAIEGLERREVLVRPDPARLAAFGLGFDDLIRALRVDGAGTPAPGSVQAVAGRTVRLPNGEPIPLSDVARVSLTRLPPADPPAEPGRAMLRVTVLATTPRTAVDVAERVHAHIAWLRANDLVPPGARLRVLHDEVQASGAWRNRVLARLAVCAVVVLALLGLVFGWRLAAAAALAFAVWFPASLAALRLLGFSLDLAAAAGLLLACLPFAMLMMLPPAGIVFTAATVGAGAFGLIGPVLGGPYRVAAATVAVATVLAAAVRWLVIPWSPSAATPVAGPLSRLWPGGAGSLPYRVAVSTAAAFVLAAAAASAYALPGVNGGTDHGSFVLRLQADDERRLAIRGRSLTVRLHAIPRVSGIESSAELIERWRLRLDPRQLAARGLDLAGIGRAFAIAQDGVLAGEIVRDGLRIPVRLQLAPGSAGASFERLLLRGERKDAPALYLADVGLAERARQPFERMRVNGTPTVELRARWQGREARAALRRVCRRLEIPPDFEADCKVTSGSG